MESVPLFDVSSEDDLLIPSSSLELGSHAACTLDAENMEKASKNVGHVPQLSESLEQNPKRPDKYNLRKSLAWDSAFFTSEGILNSKELEIMNSTYSKAMGTALPGIQEELRKSSESTCTLDSKSLALEQPGLNLFENVRDSIQKSFGSNNHTTKMIHFGKTKESKMADAPCVRTLKKVDISSQKLKIPFVSRRHDGTRQLLECTSKDGLVCLKVPSHEKGVSKPSLRPPKVSSKTNRPNVMPAQICSCAITPITGATIKQHPAVAFSNANEVQNIAHRSSSLTRSFACSPKTDPVLAAIVKKRGAERNTVHSSSTASKTYLKTSRIGPAKNHLSNLPRSSLVLSKVSPASSIDSIASESSSSKSTYMMLARSLEGSDASSQNSDSLSQTYTEDPTKTCVNSDTVAKSAKPSSLRVPRPTVGYFDKEKAKIHRTNKGLKPGLQYDLKAGVHAIATNKIKPCNIPTLRNGALPSAPSKQGTSSEVVHMKIENQQILSPKVDNFSFEIAEENHRINLKAGRGPDDRAEKVKKTCNRSKKEIPNLLQPRPFAPVNEIHTTGKLRTHDQLSCTLQVQLENVNNDLGALHF